MPTTQNTTESLPYLSSEERLKAYQFIVDGCHHLWSKNKLEKAKALTVLTDVIPLIKSDPYFLAHLTSYIMKKSKSKDLQVFLTYISSLSSADGTPFSTGSKYIKPNLRYVGAAALHLLDPKLVNRVVDIGNLKYSVPGHLNEATHFPTTLQTAVKKYLKYREANPEFVMGVKKTGLGNVFKNLYRKSHSHPSDEVAKILRWPQKDHHIDFGERMYDFSGLGDYSIAVLIREKKIPYLGVLAELARIKKKISPVIAVAMLEQATGDQAVIMHRTFSDSGILTDPEVAKLYKEKVLSAKTTLDRVDRIKNIAENAESKAMLTDARAISRQRQTAGLGKIYIHIDSSSSMQRAIDIAKESSAILAECVNDPVNNFKWGLFARSGRELPTPREFVKDAFESILFGHTAGGSTDAFALYPTAREFGAEVDILLTDGAHMEGDLALKIRRYHADHPELKKPRAAVIVDIPGMYGNSTRIKDAYEANDIPVTVLKPESLKESALVIEAVKTAMLGPVAVVDEIMNTELLKLPEYYYSI